MRNAVFIYLVHIHARLIDRVLTARNKIENDIEMEEFILYKAFTNGLVSSIVMD